MKRWIALVLVFALLLPGFAPVATAEGTEATEAVETTEVSEETVAESEAPAETDVSESQMPDGQAEQTVRINFYIFLGTMDGAQPGKHWFFPEDDVMVMSVDVPVGTTVDLNRYVPYCYDYTFRGWYMDPYAAEEYNRHEFFEITEDHLEANNHMAENGLYGLHFTAGWTAPEDSGRTMVYFDNTESAWETVACIGVTASGVEHNITIGSRETPDVYYVPLPSEIVKLYFQNASYIFGKTPSKKTKVFDVVAGAVYTYSEEPGIELSIQEEDVRTDPLICGSVISGAGETGWQIPLKVDTEEDITVTQLNLTIPTGFSFKEEELDTQTSTLPLGDELADGSITLPTIYPIYVDIANQTESGEYQIDVEVIAIDGDGKEIKCTEKLVFFRPSETDNVATSLCSFSATPYVLSLDTISGSGTVYNKETARLCVMMCNMAYDRNGVNMEIFLTGEMGFSNYERQGISINNDLTHLMGRYYASKKIIKDGKLMNLVYVICRGSAGVPLFGREWISNFDVGTGNIHEGFEGAAAHVKTELEKYYKKHEFTQDNTMILVTGHSRAAAVANLIGHWLNTEATLANKENVSVYTFATPTVDRRIATEADGYAGHENIFNWVYFQDPIRNSPSMRYYGRYGSTTLFACGSGNSGETTYDDGFYEYTLPNDGSTYTMAELLNAILYEMDPHVASHKVRFIANTAKLLSNIKLKYIGAGIGELAVAHGLQYYYKAVLTDAADEDFEYVNLSTQAALDYFKQEYCSEDVVVDSYHCPINMYVYDLDGNLAGSIVNQVVSQDDDNIILYVDGESLNMVTMKSERGNYTVQIVAYDDGSMKHSIVTVGVDSLESLQLRRDIPVTNGGVLELNGDGLIPVGTESDEDTQAAYSNYTDEEEMEKILQELDNSEAVLGDLDRDGDADAFDLTILARHVGGIEEVTDAVALANADVTGDGGINANDLTKHARFVGGIITSWDQE